MITLPTPGEDGTAEGCPSEGVTADLLEEIAEHPQRFYVNVHNATFPAGAVRGQLKQDPEALVLKPGEVNVFRERLFELDDSDPENPRPKGEQIGTVVAECTLVTVGDAPEDISARCSRVSTLDGRGDMSTSEAYTFADPLEDTLTLDGGSGEFRDAGGQIEFDVQAIDESDGLLNSIYTVHLLHLED